MENITATLCQWLYRANAGLQQMMQSYRALIHWEYICIIGNVWKIPWIWQVRMALDCDVESSTITSSIQRTQMRWVQISRFKKCCMCQYVRLESIQDSKTEFLIFQIVSRFSSLCRFFQSLMERYRALLKRTSASAWRARISMASLTVGQSYKSLAFDFGNDGKQWNVSLVNLVNLNDPEISMTSPLKLYKDTGFVQISMVEQNYRGEILPSRCTFLQSQVSWYRGGHQILNGCRRRWIFFEWETCSRIRSLPRGLTTYMSLGQERSFTMSQRSQRSQKSLIRSRFSYVFLSVLRIRPSLSATSATSATLEMHCIESGGCSSLSIGLLADDATSYLEVYSANPCSASLCKSKMYLTGVIWESWKITFQI